MFSFLARPILDLATQVNIRPIMKVIRHQINIVWSFDAYRFQNLKLFNAQLCIYHPVDLFDTKLNLTCANTADVIISVSPSILRKYSVSTTPSFFVNHGLSPVFLSPKSPTPTKAPRLKCGYVGNLTSFALHRTNFIHIIEQNPEIEFHLVGPFSASHGKDKDFVATVSSFQNTVLHDNQLPEAVAQLIQSMDLFVICYDTKQFGSVASNSHKILEYLSTGKVIVSSFIEAYSTLATGLFNMADSDSQLPQLFRATIDNIDRFNSFDLQMKRKAFASDHSYENQTNLIESKVSKFMKP